MNIRILTPNDAEQYKKVRLEALQNHPDAFAADYEDERNRPVEFYKERLQSKGSLTIGAFENSTLIGTVTLIRERHKKLSHRINLVAMYVAPNKRGLGVGKSLVTEAVRKAKEMEGIEQIYLTVVTTNESAKRLYVSAGFTVYGEDKRALKLGDTYLDEEHMVLFLGDF